MQTNCDFVLHHLQNLLETSGSIKASSLIFANICSNYLEIISVKSFPVRNKWLQGVSVGRDVKKYPKKVCNKGLRGGWHDPGKYRIITCFEAQTAIVNPVTERPAWHWGIHSFGNDCRLVHRPFWQKEVTGSQLRFHRTLTVRLTDLNPQNTNSTLIETKGGGGQWCRENKYNMEVVNCLFMSEVLGKNVPLMCWYVYVSNQMLARKYTKKTLCENVKVRLRSHSSVKTWSDRVTIESDPNLTGILALVSKPEIHFCFAFTKEKEIVTLFSVGFPRL